MILNDSAIKYWILKGGATPYDLDLINPASVDLRWSGRVKIAHLSSDIPIVRINEKVIVGGDIEAINTRHVSCVDREFAKKNSSVMWSVSSEYNSFVFEPGKFYLIDTLEYLRIPEDWSGSLALKSSYGRLGLEHLHSGYFDPGFEGTATLEIFVQSPWAIELKKGEPIVQMVFNKMASVPEKTYQTTGRYNGQNGPQTTR